jgi:hypothetical protein
MSNYKDIKKCVLKMIKYYKLKIKPEDRVKIIKRLCVYSDMLIFNIVSLVCLIILLNGNKRATEGILESLKTYIDDRCCVDKKLVIDMDKKCSKPMKGGFTSMPLAYYSNSEQPMYSRNPGFNISDANLTNGIIRPFIGGSLGGFMLGGCDSVTNCKNMNKIINKKITSIFKFYKVVSNKMVKEMLVKMFFIYINQLFVCIIKKTKGMLTLSKLNIIIQKTNMMKK